jgi:hypothetical protein
MKRHHVLLVLVAFMLSGCSSPGMYEWGNYDQWLYENYQNPKDDEELYIDLTALITKYERTQKPSKKPMAPGLYAEYGFLLMRRYENENAVEYFIKEKTLWPEAGVFMDNMIQVAKIRSQSEPTTTAEGDTK